MRYKGYRTVVLGKVPGASLAYWCNNGSFRICWYFACFQRSFIKQLERVARLLLQCLRSIARNSLGPPEESCEIVFIASMMSSLVILMSHSVFPCGCPKKSFGYLIVIVGSGVLKTLLYCSFSSSLIFFVSWFQVPLFILERSNSNSDR